MTKPLGIHLSTSPSAGQAKVEREAAETIIKNLTNALRDLGNAGVSDPNTARELERHLESGLAAAYRWLAETHVNQEALNIKKN